MQQALFQAIVESLAAACQRSRVLLAFEDGVRASIVEAMLENGCHVRLPYPGKGTGTLYYTSNLQYVFEEDLKNKPAKDPRTPGVKKKRGPKPGSRNADIRIVHPFALEFELKVRGEFGSTAQHNYAGVSSDLDRVSSGLAAMVVVADQTGYDSWRGIKPDARGASADGVFDTVFPPSETLYAAVAVQDKTKWKGVAIDVLGRTVLSALLGKRRVILILSRAATSTETADLPPANPL